MRTAIAFLILAAILLLIGIVAAIENQPQKLPLVQAAEPATVVPWRLFATCPADRRNIPTLPNERSA